MNTEELQRVTQELQEHPPINTDEHRRVIRVTNPYI